MAERFAARLLTWFQLQVNLNSLLSIGGSSCFRWNAYISVLAIISELKHLEKFKVFIGHIKSFYLCFYAFFSRKIFCQAKASIPDLPRRRARGSVNGYDL